MNTILFSFRSCFTIALFFSIFSNGLWRTASVDPYGVSTDLCHFVFVFI